MKITKGFWLFTLLIPVLTASAAPTGYCVANEGTHHNYFDVTKTFSYYDNMAGIIVSSTTSADNATFKGTCYCLTGRNQVSETTYFTSVMNPSLSSAGTHNNQSFFWLNDFLDIAMETYILGVGFVKLPYDHIPNEQDAHRCKEGVDNNITFYSGGSATVSLYVKKPIVGTMTIPLTLSSSIYATLDPHTVSHHYIADIMIKGSITVPQSCEISEGETLVIDFKKILASEFPAVKGQALNNHKITRKVAVRCSNIGKYQSINAHISAASAGTEDDMIQTSNPDVGIKIYDKQGREVNVNGGELVTDITSLPSGMMGDKNGEITFSSTPASATGAKPQPGFFNATATLTIEIEN